MLSPALDSPPKTPAGGGSYVGDVLGVVVPRAKKRSPASWRRGGALPPPRVHPASAASDKPTEDLCPGTLDDNNSARECREDNQNHRGRPWRSVWLGTGIFGILPIAAAFVIRPFAISENSRDDETDCTPCHEAEDTENGNCHDLFACWRRAPNSETLDLRQKSLPGYRTFVCVIRHKVAMPDDFSAEETGRSDLCGSAA